MNNADLIRLATDFQRIELQIQCKENYYKELREEMQNVDNEISSLELQRESLLSTLIEMLAHADR